MPTDNKEQSKVTLQEAQKEFAVKSNGRVWELLGKAERSQTEEDELLYAAHASCFHWLQVGTGVHHQRGEYLIAKVYINLGVAERALHHAHRCLALTQQHTEEMKDFDVAYAYECMARAQAMSGHREEALKFYRLAQQAGEVISNAGDKKYFDGDFAGDDWYGIA